MAMSLILCSRDRSAQLKYTLEQLDVAAMKRLDVDLVLVDSASSDDTSTVMADFAKTLQITVQVFKVKVPGASIARNVGARNARSDTLIFTDDDCYFEDGYFDAVVEHYDPERFQFAGGSTILFDETDANSGVIELPYEDTSIIKPGTLLHAGMIQSSNLVFQKKAFDKIRGFDQRLGAGTPFSCEDIELCTRASLAGFTGAFLPQLVVLHHHGRKDGTPELDHVERGYERGRGAYSAHLMTIGVNNVWDLWESWRNPEKPAPMTRDAVASLMYEFQGAAGYFEMVLHQSKLPEGP